jgi:hypothetical protein
MGTRQVKEKNMKTLTLVLLFATFAVAQDRTRPAAQPAARPAKDATTKAAASSIPSGAVQVEPFLYRYTDTQGKTWFYRQTPFGLSKWEDKPEAAPVAKAAEAEPVTATDLGDSVRFERKTPFGSTQWVRKKSDLTAEEQALAGKARPSEQAGSKEKR